MPDRVSATVPHTSRCDVNDDNEERDMMIMNMMLVVVLVMVIMPQLQCLIPAGVMLSMRKMAMVVVMFIITFNWWPW